MAEKKQQKLSFLDNFVFLNISYKFREEKESEEFKKLLSNISLNRFENVKSEYNIEKAAIFEDYLPELTRNPYLTFRFKDFEVFFSSKKINISFPITAPDFEGRIILRGGRRLSPISIPRDKEKYKLDITSLIEIESFIKIFLINNLMNKKIPELENCIVNFQIDLNHEPNFNKINQLMEEQLLKNKKFLFENFNFEIEEDKNKYYFGLTPNLEYIVCSFVYEPDQVSILKDELISILEKSYKIYSEIIRVLEV